MKEYFQLQFKLVNRKLIDFGLPLLIGYALFALVFILGSSYLFLITEFAVYAYVFVALGLVSRLSNTKRNDIIKSIFCTSDFLKIRMLENLIYTIPFILFLVYKEKYLITLLLLVSNLLLVIINFNVNLNFTIPTPFGKKPFEFVVGLRKTFFMFPIAYIITYAAISVRNFNLGVFSLIIIGIVCLSYYLKPEHEYFVWNFNLSPKEFLIEKIKTCLLFFTFLCAPILLALSISFFQEIDILIAFYMVSCTFLVTIILAKYSAYPNEMSIPHGVLIALGFMFPPILIGLIPYFYSKSINQLTEILNDSY